jgi:hypothetical protein
MLNTDSNTNVSSLFASKFVFLEFLTHGSCCNSQPSNVMLTTTEIIDIDHSVYTVNYKLKPYIYEYIVKWDEKRKTKERINHNPLLTSTTFHNSQKNKLFCTFYDYKSQDHVNCLNQNCEYCVDVEKQLDKCTKDLKTTERHSPCSCKYSLVIQKYNGSRIKSQISVN